MATLPARPGVHDLAFPDRADEYRQNVKQGLKDVVEESGLAKVITLSKLKSKFESFEARRQLAASYDLFLADSRIAPRLPALLGEWL